MQTNFVQNMKTTKKKERTEAKTHNWFQHNFYANHNTQKLKRQQQQKKNIIYIRKNLQKKNKNTMQK